MFFITYFVVIATKTYTTLVLTYLYPCMTKLRRKSHNLSQNRFFWTSKQPLAIRSFKASYSVCPVAIPELFMQTQESDYWQLIRCSRLRLGQLFFAHVSYPPNFPHVPYLIVETRGGTEHITRKKPDVAAGLQFVGP